MERDDDIEFDFFDDEPATSETAQSRMRLPRRGGGRTAGPRRPLGPPHGVKPLLRLLALVCFVVVVVLVFALLIQSCASTKKHDAYAGYIEDVTSIGAQSATNGKAVATTLASPSLSVTKIQEKLRGIAEQERQNVRRAQELDPPGRLRDENAHLVDALALRVAGVDGLADAFQKVAGSKADTDAALLAAQAERLVASDVVWDDLFKAPAVEQLTRDGVGGVQVPTSHFVPDPDLMTARSFDLVIARLRGASTGGTPSGRHGTDIVSVKAQPGDQTLVAGQLNTVTATTELGFDVTVHDGGDSQEVGIAVTLTIEQGTGKPIVKTEKIDLINPDESKVVSFTGLGEVRFATQTTLKVDVAPVLGETFKDNNSAQFNVIFSLP
jgi:hypothetical protein